MLDWIQEHRALLAALTAASALMFVVGLVAVPALIVRIPADYFAHERRPPSRWAHRHPLVRAAFHVGKNVLGVAFVLAGVAMLVLPGQGLLTILCGFLMLDFPGKYRCEKWLLSRRHLHEGINWLRRRSGHEPLRVESRSAPGR